MQCVKSAKDESYGPYRSLLPSAIAEGSTDR